MDKPIPVVKLRPIFRYDVKTCADQALFGGKPFGSANTNWSPNLGCGKARKVGDAHDITDSLRVALLLGMRALSLLPCPLAWL